MKSNYVFLTETDPQPVHRIEASNIGREKGFRKMEIIEAVPRLDENEFFCKKLNVNKINDGDTCGLTCEFYNPRNKRGYGICNHHRRFLYDKGEKRSYFLKYNLKK